MQPLIRRSKRLIDNLTLREDMKTATILEVITFRRNNPSATFNNDACSFKRFNELLSDSAVLIQSFTNTPHLRVSYYA